MRKQGTGNVECGENILEVRDLSVRFPIKKGVFARTTGYVDAVDGVSFSLRRGETLGIVGESGSGKTTIARVIAGLQRPTAGSFELDGRVAMVFQDPLGSLNPRMTVRQMLEEALKNSSPSTQIRSLFPVPCSPSSLLALVGLDEGELDKYPHAFSGGQRQRLCIARALATGPDLLICDEAVSALDLSIRAQILGLLADLKGKFGLSLLFITHDLGVVQHIADRILVMERGKRIEEGPCGQVLKAPQEEYTRLLVSSVPKIGKPLT